MIAINIRGDKEVAINEEYTLSEKELANEIQVKYTASIVLPRLNSILSFPLLLLEQVVFCPFHCSF